MSDKKSTFPGPTVAIVILNWNDWKDTMECLESLYQVTYPNYYVILVDNFSDDDSVQMIRDYCLGKKKVESEFLGTGNIIYPIPIQEYDRVSLEDRRKATTSDLLLPGGLILIKNERNFGFAEGNNIGMRFALQSLRPDYVLLLNSDTLVDREFLAELVRVAEKDGQIGSLQALLLKPGGKVIDSLGQEPWQWGTADVGINSLYVETNVGEHPEIFGPCAAAALYRSDALRKSGLFDGDFFILYEDVDLSWRIRLQGFTSRLVPSSLVYHKRGISQGRSSSPGARLLRSYYGTRNWILVAMRYYPTSIVHSFTFFRAVGRCLLMALRMGMVQETLSLLKKSASLRKAILSSPILSEIQTRWIRMS
jgi:GT2 family glycosyltransferase